MLDFFDRLFSRSDPQRNGGFRRRNPDFLTWLYPGMHVKRWLLLLMFGVALFGLGVAYFLRDIYVFYTFPEPVYYITLQFLPRTIRGVLFIIVAASAIGFGVAGLNRSLLSAMRNGNSNNQNGRPLVSLVYQHRYGNRGPKTVAIGGGTGLSVLLRGMKEHTDNLTAIVTVADDGGSSGILRRELGVLPPGDFRNCIAALADAEPLVTRLMQYRFSEGSGLEGHSFGNLFIVAMTGVVGNFEEALRETGRVLAVRGQILPATLDNVTLTAEMADAQTVRGRAPHRRNTSPHLAGLLRPAQRDAVPGRYPSHSRCGVGGPGPRQRVYQRPSQPAGEWHSPGHPRLQSHQGLRVQRSHPAR